MREWQPIETAPKDGTWIVVGQPDWPLFPQARWEILDGEDENGHVFFGAWVFKDDLTSVPGAVDAGMVGWSDDIEDGVMPTVWCHPPNARPEPPDTESRRVFGTMGEDDG